MAKRKKYMKIKDMSLEEQLIRMTRQRDELFVAFREFIVSVRAGEREKLAVLLDMKKILHPDLVEQLLNLGPSESVQDIYWKEINDITGNIYVDEGYNPDGPDFAVGWDELLPHQQKMFPELAPNANDGDAEDD